MIAVPSIKLHNRILMLALQMLQITLFSHSIQSKMNAETKKKVAIFFCTFYFIHFRAKRECALIIHTCLFPLINLNGRNKKKTHYIKNEVEKKKRLKTKKKKKKFKLK